MVQVLAIALAALRLLTRLFEASKALLELVKSSLEGHYDGRREKARAQPRRLKE